MIYKKSLDTALQAPCYTPPLARKFARLFEHKTKPDEQPIHP
jgi:hypothetical protein